MKLTRPQLEQLLNNTHISSDGRDLYADCPSCGHSEFGISLSQENNPYSCFRKSKCGVTGNIYTLLKLLGKSREYLGERQIDIDGLLPPLNQVVEEEIRELPIIEPPVGWRRVFDDPYLRMRGFTDKQFQKHKVGRSFLKRDYVTFLVEMDNKITAYISRSVKSKEFIDSYNNTHDNKIIRYQNSTSDFSKMLFGYDEIIPTTTSDLILVEGILSKTKTDTNLDLDSISHMKCCATFGAKISSEQIRLIKEKEVKTIWLWFEADVLDKLKKVAAQLSIHFNVRCSYLSGFDPGDIDREKAFYLLENSMNFLEIDQNFL